MNLTFGEKYLVDTNVLIYSVDRSSPFNEGAKKILEAGVKEDVSLFIAHQNLVEFMAVLTRGYGIGIKQAVKDAEAFASQFDVIFPLPGTIDVFFKMANTHKKIYPFDLYLASTAFDNGIERIITGNRKDFSDLNFKEIAGIE